MQGVESDECKMRTPQASLIIWNWKFIFLVMILCSLVHLSNSACEFDAIFNFGDSNSDTGGFNAAFPAQGGPFGMTYFKKPVGRSSDGRLILDFLSISFGFPFLGAYLQSIGTDFRHGVNFATAASTVVEPTFSLSVSGLSPFSLDIQVKQLKQFKARVIENYQQQSHITTRRVSYGNNGCSSLVTTNNLPSPDVFGKSIYTIYIGQNDFTSKLAFSGLNAVKDYMPQVITQIDSGIKELYAQGGRTFLVFNLGPVGCYPGYLVEIPHDSSDVDEFGCVISHNKAVDDCNKLLKETLGKTRETLKAASLIYVDTHSALLELFQHPTSHGLKYSRRACCGHGGGDYNFEPKIMCGNMAATACEDPQNYVSWDGIHFTEAANKFVASAILNSSLFDPPFPLHKHCDLKSIN